LQLLKNTLLTGENHNKKLLLLPSLIILMLSVLFTILCIVTHTLCMHAKASRLSTCVSK